MESYRKNVIHAAETSAVEGYETGDGKSTPGEIERLEREMGSWDTRLGEKHLDGSRLAYFLS